MIRSDHPEREKLTVEEAMQALKRELADVDVEFEIWASNDPANKSSHFTLSCRTHCQLIVDRDYLAGWEIERVQYFPSDDSLTFNICFVRERYTDIDVYDDRDSHDSETVSWLCEECSRKIRTPSDAVVEEGRELCQTCADDSGDDRRQ